MVLASTTTLAFPAVSVITGLGLLNSTSAPTPGPAKVTENPAKGAAPVSVTVTSSGWPNAVLTVVDWASPPLTVTVGGVLVRLKMTITPGTTLAATAYIPGVLFAVAVTEATPETSVTAESPDNTASAPVPGPAKTMSTPSTAVPPSVALTTSGSPKPWLTTAL